MVKLTDGTVPYTITQEEIENNLKLQLQLSKDRNKNFKSQAETKKLVELRDRVEYFKQQLRIATEQLERAESIHKKELKEELKKTVGKSYNTLTGEFTDI